LIEKHLGQAHLIALRMTNSQSIAEDAVQEACVAMVRKPPEFRSEEKLLHYFYKAVCHCATDLKRREQKRRKREESYMADASTEKDSPEESQVNSDLSLAAQVALNSLPPSDRIVVSLCFEQGFSHQAAAELLGIPRQTVGHRLNRSLSKMRKSLTGKGFAISTPLLVGQSLSTLPLPAAPASLTSFLGNLATNPTLAAQFHSVVSLKTLAIASAKKSALGYFWGVSAVAVFGVAAATAWQWNANSNQTSQVFVTKSSIEEIIYEDEFDGERLADFWQEVKPARQVTLRHPDYPSAAVIEVVGAKVAENEKKLEPAAYLISKPFIVSKGITEVLIFVKIIPEGARDFFGFSLLSETGEILNYLQHVEESDPAKDGVKYIKINRSGGAFLCAVYIFPSGEVIACLDNEVKALGQMRDSQENIRLSLHSVAFPNSAKTFCLLEKMSIRKIKAPPPEIAEKREHFLAQMHNKQSQPPVGKTQK
jgi:RNA polymerase sigma factor (sigma-70 family)